MYDRDRNTMSEKQFRPFESGEAAYSSELTLKLCSTGKDKAFPDDLRSFEGESSV